LRNPAVLGQDRGGLPQILVRGFYLPASAEKHAGEDFHALV